MSLLAANVVMLTLAVLRPGDGIGTVTSNPAGITCGNTCAAAFMTDAQVTLTAVPDADANFTGWTGCDSLSGSTCTVSIDAARSVNAIFVLKRFTLTATTSGVVKGTIISSPPGISCGTACASDYAINTVVTLTATPDRWSKFNGWTGCDAVNGSECLVNVTNSKSVVADFTAVPRP
jgi:serine protease